MARGEDTAPSDWPWETLEALAGPEGVVCDGDWVESKDQNPNGEVRLIQLADIGDGFFRDRSDRFLTLKRARELNCTFLCPGDLLIARMPDPLGRACIFPDIGQPAVTVVDVCVWRPGESNFDVRWLMHFINSPSMRATIQAQATGTTRQRISGARLKATKVRVPPTLLRPRISQRIEDLFGEIEAGEQELAAAKADMQRYRRAVLKAAVTGELTRDWREQNPPNETGADLLARILKDRRARWEDAERAKLVAKGQTPKNDAWKTRYPEPVAPNTDDLPALPEGWTWITIEQVCTGARAIAYGVLQPGEHLPGGVTLIRVSDVADGRVDQSALKQIEPSIADQFPRTKLLGREVLLTVVGTIGRTAIVPPELAGANVARAVAMLPVSESISEEWVELALRTTESRRALTDAAHEVARKTLNLEDVRRYAVPLPPESERNEALALALDALSKIDDAQGVIDAAARDAARLRQSVLASAFGGKLVAEAAVTASKTKRRHVA